MITGEQIRAARKLLGWRQAELAKQARISAHSVESAESSVGESFVPGQDMQAMRAALAGLPRRAGTLADEADANGPLEVITGAQIRQARELLGWPPTSLPNAPRCTQLSCTVYQAALILRSKRVAWRQFRAAPG